MDVRLLDDVAKPRTPTPHPAAVWEALPNGDTGVRPGGLEGRTEAATRVIVAGGSPLYQVAMVTLLKEDARIKLIARVSTMADALAQVRSQGCDVLTLYTERPQEDAAWVIERLRGQATPKLLILTESENRYELLASVRAGAHGYAILRNLDPEDLRGGVLTLARSGNWVCPITTSYLMRLASQRPAAPPPRVANLPSLSDREVSVLRLLAGGDNEKQIAQELYLSPNTVKTYLRRICEKFDVTTRGDAIRLAIQAGLIPDRRTYSA